MIDDIEADGRRDARARRRRGAGRGRDDRDRRLVEEEHASLRPALPCPTIYRRRRSSTTRRACARATCGGGKFGRIGADEREVLEYIPPSHFKRVVHVRPKMSCRACETVVQAPMPTLPIEKGRPGPSLLAHVVVSKFCDHLPLHRRPTSTPAAALRSTVRSWRAGSAVSPDCSNPRARGSSAMFAPASRCTPTTVCCGSTQKG